MTHVNVEREKMYCPNCKKLLIETVFPTHLDSLISCHNKECELFDKIAVYKKV